MNQNNAYFTNNQYIKHHAPLVAGVNGANYHHRIEFQHNK